MGKINEIKTAIFVLAMSSIPYIQEAQEVTTFDNNVNSEIQSNDKFENKFINAFDSEKTVWTYLYSEDCRIGQTIHKTVLFGDTIIDGVKWKIITGEPRIEKGLVRADGSKVLFKPYPGYEDMVDFTSHEKFYNDNGYIVIYDFSLEVGDNVLTRGSSQVLETDSITLNDGYKHKQLIYDNYGNSFIEGVGSANHSPLFMIYDITTCQNDATFVCCHVNDELLYTNPIYADCTQSKQWNVLYENAGQQKYTHVFKFESDTVIAGKEYSVLWMSVDEKVENWRRLGFVHENLEEKKIFYRPSWGDRDGLMYDFSAEENDTVYTIGNSWFELTKPNSDYWMTDSIENVVMSVDLVKLNDHYHKRIKVESKPLMPEMEAFENDWIEGIGNFKGLFSYNISFSGTPNQTLLAFYLYGELIYQSPEYDSDFIWNGVNNDHFDNQKITILLNGRNLQITGLSEQSYLVTIYSISGTPLLQQKGDSSLTIIPLSKLSSGVYIVNINSNKTSISRKIIIK